MTPPIIMGLRVRSWVQASYFVYKISLYNKKKLLYAKRVQRSQIVRARKRKEQKINYKRNH